MNYSDHATSFNINLAGPNIPVVTSLMGDFNIQNILAAVGVFISLGLSHEIIQSAIKNCKGIPGRMELLENNEGYFIYVDYAHTPDALEKVLTNLR